MSETIANVDMAAAWDGDEGSDWARDWERYDRTAAPYHAHLLSAAGIADGDRVLDVGCGNGESTRAAARASGAGRALGVDLSTEMLARARELAAAQGVENASFLRADVQVHPFEPSSFDVAISRFGAMFFADPVAAFANVCASLRPGGRLAVVTWRSVADNEWLQCVFGALAVGRDLPVPPAGAPGPFGLADPDLTRKILGEAGFADVDLTPLDEPFWAGADGADAYGFMRGVGITRGMIQDLDDAQRTEALANLERTMLDHETPDGVQFGSGCWLVTASRPRS